MDNSTLHRDLRAFMRLVVMIQSDGVLCEVRMRPKTIVDLNVLRYTRQLKTYDTAFLTSQGISLRMR